jgi:hypothetical protein
MNYSVHAIMYAYFGMTQVNKDATGEGRRRRISKGGTASDTKGGHGVMGLWVHAVMCGYFEMTQVVKGSSWWVRASGVGGDIRAAENRSTWLIKGRLGRSG